MLLARPIPLADESQGSILMRAAYLNGWQDTGAMLRGCCNRYSGGVGLFRNRKTFQDQIDLLGIDLPSDMYLCQQRRASSAVMLSFNSQLELPCDMFRAEGSAVCPRCIQDFPYLKRIWSLRLISTCHLHGCLLVHHCRECVLPLDLNRPAPHLCRCSFDLRQAPAEHGEIIIAKSMHDIVDSGDQKCLNTLCENFLALERFFSAREKPYTDEQLNCLVAQGRPAILAYMVSHIASRVDIEHPRVALASLLRSPGYMHDLAVSVLREISNIVIPSVANRPIEGTFDQAESAAALGLSKSTYVLRLHHAKLIEVQKFELLPSRIKYLKSSIDALLRKLWVPTNDRNVTIRQRPLVEKIPQLISDILLSPSISAGYDLDKGLCGLRRMDRQNINGTNTLCENLLTVEQAANQLNVYPKIIRSLLHKRYLNGEKVLYQGRRIFISKEQIVNFNEKYAFVGALARSIGASRTQFIHYLTSHEIRPISGPGIDGLSVYLVARVDIAHLDLAQLRIKRTSSRGSQIISDPSSCDQVADSNYLTISEVARKLGLSVTFVAKLVRDGKLERFFAPIDAVTVTKKSFESFRDRMTDSSFRKLTDVLILNNEKREEFLFRWVTTGLVNLIQVGDNECISNHHYKKILSLKRRYITAKEFAMQFDRGRHILPNLEMRGLITSVRMGVGHGIKLYRRKNVMKLVSMGLLSSGL